MLQNIQFIPQKEIREQNPYCVRLGKVKTAENRQIYGQNAWVESPKLSGVITVLSTGFFKR